MIKDVDDDGRHVDALDLPMSSEPATKRWQEEKMRAMIA